MQHCNNQSMNMICQGNWDVVVLQEQSQYPSFGQEQVEAEVFPYARRLVDSIYENSHGKLCPGSLPWAYWPTMPRMSGSRMSCPAG